MCEQFGYKDGWMRKSRSLCMNTKSKFKKIIEHRSNILCLVLCSTVSSVRCARKTGKCVVDYAAGHSTKEGWLHLLGKLGALLQAGPKLGPMPHTVIHLTVPVVLLGLVKRGCRQSNSCK